MSQIIEGKRHDKLHIVFTLISEAPPFIFTIRSACKCQSQHNIIIFRKAYIVRAPDRILIVVSAVCPVIRAGMSVNEYRQEQLYLNENVDIFIDGTYVPLWKQKLIRDKGDNNDKNA